MPGLTSSHLQQIFKIRNNSIYKNNLYTAWMYKKEKINDKKLSSVGVLSDFKLRIFFCHCKFQVQEYKQADCFLFRIRLTLMCQCKRTSSQQDSQREQNYASGE